MTLKEKIRRILQPMLRPTRTRIQELEQRVTKLERKKLDRW